MAIAIKRLQLRMLAPQRHSSQHHARAQISLHLFVAHRGLTSDYALTACRNTIRVHRHRSSPFDCAFEFALGFTALDGSALIALFLPSG